MEASDDPLLFWGNQEIPQGEFLKKGIGMLFIPLRGVNCKFCLTYGVQDKKPMFLPIPVHVLLGVLCKAISV